MNTPEQEKAARAGWEKKQKLIKSKGKVDIKPKKKAIKELKGVSK